MQRVLHTLRSKPYILAIAFTLLIVLWLMSGMGGEDQQQDAKAETKAEVIQKVKVSQLLAEELNREVKLYGRTQADRKATMRAEVNGQVDQVVAKRGAEVTQGELLLALDENDLKQQIAAAKALVKQRKIEFEGAKTLGKKGLQGESQQAAAASNLAAAQAQQASLELALVNTKVKAPFPGIFNSRSVEQGDYLKSGDPIGEMIDLDPIIVRANIAEQYRGQITVGDEAVARLVTGEVLTGDIRYISSMSEQGSNTFELEVAIANPDSKYQAGLSAELELKLEQVSAIKLAPSLLSLDENGDIGVKSVIDGIVQFTPINMVKSDSDFVWLTGFGSSANIITLGQGFVRHGDKVDVDYVRAGE